jgi:hypothetical protein
MAIVLFAMENGWGRSWFQGVKAGNVAGESPGDEEIGSKQT